MANWRRQRRHALRQWISGAPVWLHCPNSHPVDSLLYLGRWFDLTTHRQTWLFSSTNYHSTDLLIERIASPTWSSTERVARPATKRFHSKQLVQNDTHVVNRTPHTKVNSGMSRLIRLFMWLGRWTVDVVLTVVHLDDFTSGGNWTLLQEPRMTAGLYSSV